MAKVIVGIFIFGLVVVIFGWIMQFLEKYGIYIVYSIIGILCLALIYKFIGFRNSKKNRAINKISDDFFNADECPTSLNELQNYFYGYLDDIIEETKSKYSHTWSAILENAIKNNNLDTVNYLLSKNIDINTESLLEEAFEETDYNIIEFFLSNDIYDIYDILIIACEYKNEDIINDFKDEIVFLDDDKSKVLLISAVRSKQYDLCKYLIEEFDADINTYDEDGDTLLHNAVYFEDINIVKFLIDNGADLNLKNNKNYTPYDYAKSKKNNEIIEIIIQNDVDNKTKYLQDKIILSINDDNINELKSTIKNIDDISLIAQDILLYCQEHQKHDALVHLIESGTCLVSYLEKFLIFVHSENKDKANEMFEYLINKTPSTEICDKKGTTPLFFAVSYGILDWVKILLKNGANIFATKKFFKDNIDLTPLEAAETFNHNEIAEYFRSFIENKKNNLSNNKFDLNDKTFRLFISSTFSDFKREREILHKNVFPEITKYCDERNLNFQPIDLRWGISSEAQLDQKTMQLCLDEVRACKTFPHPNFIILAGDRYGYIPCPYMIEKEEFESILNVVEDEKSLKCLQFWYKLDKNQIYNESTAYILQPRNDIFLKRENWKKEEEILRKSLQYASNKIFNDKNDKEYLKYFTSATEAEVTEGISHYGYKTKLQENYDEEIDKDYVFGYVRTIENSSGIYVDKEEDLQNNAKLFKDKISNVLKDGNKFESKYNSIEDYENNELKNFEKYFIEKIKYSVDEYLLKIDDINSLDFELSEQNMYRQSKLKNFEGREVILKKIEEYTCGNNDYYKRTHILEQFETYKHPLIVHGSSGMGKSALIAKLIENISSNNKYKNNSILYRFIGATAKSTSTHNFLTSLSDELQYLNIIDPIKECEDIEDLENQVRIALNSVKRETIIFIDALDQLEEKNYLKWIPEKLSNKLKIIITVLNDENYEKDSHYYDLLKDRLSNLSMNLIDISSNSLNKSKKTILKNYLSSYGRTLIKSQRDYVLSKWEKTNYSPLYLTIILENIKHWKSFDNEFKVKDNTKDAILDFIDSLNKIYHYEKLLINKVLAYIHTSKYGLSEKELLEILSHDLEDEKEFQNVIINEFHEPIKVENIKRNNQLELILPISIWSRLHTQLKPFIVLRNINNQKLMKFFHRQFNTVVEELIMNDKIYFHKKLADYFYLLQEKSKTWNARYYNLHMLDEYPFHLINSNNIDRLKEIIFDLEFIGSIYDNNKHIEFKNTLMKIIDLNLIDESEINPWKSFMVEKEYSILNENSNKLPHESLFKLAYFDGDNSPLSLKADKILANNKIDFDFTLEKKRPKKFTRTGLLKVINREKHKFILGDKIKVLPNGNICIFNGKRVSIFDDGLNLIYNVHNNVTLPISGVEIFDDNKILTYDSFNIYIWSEKGELLDDPVTDEENWIDEVIINSNIIIYKTDKIISLRDFNNYHFAYLSILSLQSNIHVTGIKLFTNNIIIIYYSNGAMQLFDIEDFIINSSEYYGKFITDLIAIQAHEEKINGVEVFNKSSVGIENVDKHFITYSDDNTLKVWNYSCSNPIILEGHIVPVSGVEVYGDKILSYADDGSLILWNFEGKLLKNLKAHDDRINGIKIFDEKILTYSNDKKLKIWSINGELLKVIEGHENHVYNVEILHNQDILSFSKEQNIISATPTIYIWDKNGSLKGKINSLTEPIKILPNNNIISSYKNHTMKLWSSSNIVSEVEK